MAHSKGSGDGVPNSDEERVTVSFTVPAWLVAGRELSSEAFACWVRVAAAMFRFGRGEISLGTASALAGMSQAEFMHALREAQQETVVLDSDDLDHEFAFLAERRSQAGHD